MNTRYSSNYRCNGLHLFLIVLLVLMNFWVIIPPAGAQGGPARGVASPFPGEVSEVASPVAGPDKAIGIQSAGTTGIPGAGNWLLSQQDASGGFPWTVGDGVTSNTQGPTARGMLAAYLHDGDGAYLTSAVATGGYLVPTYPRTYTTDGDPHFATHDPLFLEMLSQANGDAQYANFVQQYFWDKLTSSTYGEANDMSAADFGNAVVSGRAGQNIVELSPWDLSATAIAAHLAGETASRDALMAAILSGLEQTGVADNDYDVIGLAGAVWASAVTGVDLDPTTGRYAGANSTADLAASLATMTLTGNDGAWLYSTAADATDSTNADVQTTAFAIMALNAHDRTTYLGQIARGVAFIRSLQTAQGQFLPYEGAASTVNSGVEVHAEALAAVAAVAPTTVYVDDDWPTTWGADPDGAGPAIAFGYDAFGSVQEGINGVQATGTVNVAAGAYNENVTIARSVNLLGETGAALDGTGLGLVTGVSISAGNVTFDNFSVANFGGNGIVVGYPQGAYQNVHLTNNRVHNIRPGSSHGFGIYVGYEAEAFTPGRPDELTAHLDYSGLLISGNEVYETANAALVLQSITALSGNLAILNNNLHDADASCIWLDTARNIELEGNTLKSCSNGLYLSAIADGWYVADGTYGPKDLAVEGNLVQGNVNRGLAVYAGWPATFDIHHNVFVENQGQAAENFLAAGTVSVADNWWGCNYGPGQGGQGCSAAPNDVAGSFTVDPWLTLSLVANPTTVTISGTAALTGALTLNSNGLDTSGQGVVPTLPIDFGATLGSVTPPTSTLVAGEASSLFTAGSATGTAIMSTMVSSQTVTTTVQVEPDTRYIFLPILFK